MIICCSPREDYLLFSRSEAPKPEYHPRNIGSSTLGTAGTQSYLITGKEGKGAEVQILTVFLKHKARILSHSSYVDERTGEFTMSLVCDLQKADSTPDDFLIYLTDVKSVKNVLTAKMKDRLFERFLFPLTLLDSDRVIALNADFIFQLQNHLEPQLSKSVLTRLGKSYALDVIKRIRDRLQGAEESTIAENVVDYLRSAGWGTFSWKTEGEIEQVVLQDPPLSDAGDARGNLFVIGMGAGIVSAFRKKNMAVMSAYYNRETRLLSMVLADEMMVGEQPQVKAEVEKENDKPHEVEKAIEPEEAPSEDAEEEPDELRVPVLSENGGQVVVSSPKQPDLQFSFREDEFNPEETM